jgi:class 3 adenylate cyclase/tetratricopeptide (TPR) repeat protein
LSPPDLAPEVRKTVTVLSVDLVGSTDLGERLDPEVLRNVLQRYYELMAGIATRFGGAVEKFIGDAILAIFGIPSVGEDDAIRAVTAAETMRDSMAELNAELADRWGVEIQTRAGVNTGEVVVGSEVTVDGMVMGDVANVAARLQASIGPGEIVVSGTTAQLVRSSVELEQIEPLTVKGKRDPVIAFRVVGLLAPEARGSLSSPFVGRTAELEVLEAELARAVSDRSCRLALILGDPGIGKSRLVSEFVARAGSSATVLRAQCPARGEGATMNPFADLVRISAEIVPADGRREARAKLEALVGRIGADRSTEDALASLLDLDEAIRPLEDIFRGVRHVLESVAHASYAIVVIDDLHRADPATPDAIEYLLRTTRSGPVLIVGTGRPEFIEERPSFGGDSGRTLFLPPLPADTARTLVEWLVGEAGDALEGIRIEETAEGNPLFIEQVALMLRESLDVSADDTVAYGASREPLAVPPTISALLEARVDGLSSDERIVAQRASVLGRTFALEDVAALLPEIAPPTLMNAIERLITKRILRSSDGGSGSDDVSFGHGLIRDSAYRSLLKSQRAELHERCADHLEQTRGERVAEHAVEIGSQLEAAVRNRLELGSDAEGVRSLSIRAAVWLAAAGRSALARGDVTNAEALLRRAAALLPADESERLAVLEDLGMARSDLGQLVSAEAALSEVVARSSPASAIHWRAKVDLAQLVFGADPERMGRDTVRRTVEDAIRALTHVGDDRGLARANYALASVHVVSGRTADMVESLERALMYARQAGDARTIAGCVGDLGYGLFYGDTPAMAGLERLAELARTFPDARPSVLGPMAALFAMLDRFDESRQMLQERSSLAAEFGQSWALAQTEWWAGFVEALGRELGSAEAHLRAAHAISLQLGIRRMAGQIAGDLTEVLYELGREEEAFAIAEDLRTNPPAHDALVLNTWRGVHGKVLASRGRSAEAEQEVREGLSFFERAGTPMLAGRFLMDLAEVQRLSGKKDEAIQTLEGAVRSYAAKGSLPSVREAERTLEELLGDRGR